LTEVEHLTSSLQEKDVVVMIGMSFKPLGQVCSCGFCKSRHVYYPIIIGNILWGCFSMGMFSVV